jgi:hypothetical protein
VQIDWSDYLRVHADRRNLIIHIIAVPLFLGASISLAVYLLRGDYPPAAIAAALSLLAMILQGRGHAIERGAPIPFSGTINFLLRWFREQFVIFPVFVISGRWWQQLRSAGSERLDEA